MSIFILLLLGAALYVSGEEANLEEFNEHLFDEEESNAIPGLDGTESNNGNGGKNKNNVIKFPKTKPESICKGSLQVRR